MKKRLERAVRSLEYETSWYSDLVQEIGCELSSTNIQERLQPVEFELCWGKGRQVEDPVWQLESKQASC
jgi:hypothetical protein